MASNGSRSVEKKSSSDLLHCSEERESLESLLLLKKKCQPPVPAVAHSTFRVPESSVLSRVRNFLPELRQAEEALQRRVAEAGADSVSIEADDSERPHIEMSLGLCELDSGDDSDSSQDSQGADSDAEGVPVGPVTADNIQLPGRSSSRPRVTELEGVVSTVPDRK